MTASRPTPEANRRHRHPGEHFDYDPRHDVLIPCARCGHKAPLKLWQARLIKRGIYAAEPSYLQQIECIDTAGCRERIQAAHDARVAQAKRRRPDLPHPNAPAGTCKWCGQPVHLDQRRKGWKRRRTRGYHRGDEWERSGQPTDCYDRAMVWLDPRSADQILLRRQRGACVVCGAVLAIETEATYWDGRREVTYCHWRAAKVARLAHMIRNDWSVGIGERDEVTLERANWDIDHELAIVDGGTNTLENLRAICHKPCHAEKTAREAKERAARRRAADDLEAPVTQLSLEAA